MLLPGLDGTGDLFKDFVRALPSEVAVVTMRYPTDRCLPYSELMEMVRAACPPSSLTVLVAESFSTPLAIQYAATNPANLKGLVLCAGFAMSPVQGFRRLFCTVLMPIVFRIRLPELAAKRWLVGVDAPPSLLNAIRSAIASVQAKVLLDRIHAVLTCDVRAELGRVTVPILYIQAAQDRLVKPSSFENMKRIKSQVTVARVDGPHLLLQKEPGKAAEIIWKFVQQLR